MEVEAIKTDLGSLSLLEHARLAEPTYRVRGSRHPHSRAIALWTRNVGQEVYREPQKYICAVLS